MAFAIKEQLGICAIAMFNGFFIYPYIKRAYRKIYTVDAKATHYVFEFKLNALGFHGH